MYYRKRHQEQLKALLQQLAAEEQAAASRMIEKHSNEMLQLIEEKVWANTEPRAKSCILYYLPPKSKEK